MSLQLFNGGAAKSTKAHFLFFKCVEMFQGRFILLALWPNNSSGSVVTKDTPNSELLTASLLTLAVCSIVLKFCLTLCRVVEVMSTFLLPAFHKLNLFHKLFMNLQEDVEACREDQIPFWMVHFQIKIKSRTTSAIFDLHHIYILQIIPRR